MTLLHFDTQPIWAWWVTRPIHQTLLATTHSNLLENYPENRFEGFHEETHKYHLGGVEHEPKWNRRWTNTSSLVLWRMIHWRSPYSRTSLFRQKQSGWKNRTWSYTGSPTHDNGSAKSSQYHVNYSEMSEIRLRCLSRRMFNWRRIVLCIHVEDECQNRGRNAWEEFLGLSRSPT